MLFQKVFLTVFPVFSLIGAGYLFGRWKKIDLEALNEVTLYIAVPALIFVSLIQKSITFEMFTKIFIAGSIVVTGSGIISLVAAKLLKVPCKTFVPPIMFMNSGNMGFPLALFAFGEEGLTIAIILFIASNLFHFTLGIFIINSKDGLSGIFKIPILHATVLALAGSYFQVKLPSFIFTPLEMTGNMAIPLMLFSLGYRLTSVKVDEWNVGIWGAFLRPFSGLIITFVIILFLPLTHIEKASLFLYATLPPAVLNFIIAEKYNQQPEVVASIVMLGTVFSLFYIPALLAFYL